MKNKTRCPFIVRLPKSLTVSYFFNNKNEKYAKNKCYNDPGETQTDEVEGGQEVPGTEEQSNEGEN